MKKQSIVLSALAVSMLISGTGASAREENTAYRLGAFSGAMKYCEERYDEKSVRYGLARLRVAGEVDGLSGKEKLVALTARDRAYGRGQFLGNRLDRNECRALLKMGEWRRFITG